MDTYEPIASVISHTIYNTLAFHFEMFTHLGSKSQTLVALRTRTPGHTLFVALLTLTPRHKGRVRTRSDALVIVNYKGVLLRT